MKLHTPIGVRDLLFEECALKKKLVMEIETLFEGYGYQKIETPTFEYYDVFHNEWGRNKQEKLYNFFDRDGKVLTLRPDLTAPALRVAATSLEEESMPLRLYYSGNSYRYNNPQKGNFREFSVVGLELLSEDSPYADAEVICLAIESIRKSGIENFQIELGQAQYFKWIAQGAGITGDEIYTILQYIDQKNDVMLQNALDGYEMNPVLKQILLELPHRFGGIEVIDPLLELETPKEAKVALIRLKAVYTILKSFGLEKYITIDLGLISSFGYYTGIVFKGYTYGVGYSILSGGRYNDLPKEFGLETGAIGFGLKIDRLAVSYKMQKLQMPKTGPELVISYAENYYSEAFRIATEYRNKGVSTQLSLTSSEIESDLAYCESKEINQYIYIDVKQTILYKREEGGTSWKSSQLR